MFSKNSYFKDLVMKKIILFGALMISFLRADSLDEGRIFAGFGSGLYSNWGKVKLTNYDEKIKSSSNILEVFLGIEYSDGDFNGANLVLSFSGVLPDSDVTFSEIAASIGFNYVFEPQDLTPNFAIITGVDIGFRGASYFEINDTFYYNGDIYGIHLVNKNTSARLGETSYNFGSNDKGHYEDDFDYSFAMNYNLGFRLRYKHYALLWNTKFSLVPISIPLEYRLYSSFYGKYIDTGNKGKLTYYPIATTLSFVYFF